MYGQQSTQPTFGAYPTGAYGQPPSFGQAAPGNWQSSSMANEDKLGHKPVKDPLLAVIK